MAIGKSADMRLQTQIWRCRHAALLKLLFESDLAAFY
jgi:hypothetical protein